jgi:hypothetical protein
VTRYAVEVSDTAWIAIAVQARHIAENAGAPGPAARWLERIWQAIESLERWPRRASLAEEDAMVDYEVRRLTVDEQLLLFTIDNSRSTVLSVGLRHGKRLARPDDLPSSSGDGP